MVDQRSVDNHVDGSGGKPAWELPLLLVGGFRVFVEAAHALLAERGHPGVRPVHGFALQAVAEGCTASELASRLGVSKQAVARTLGVLEDDGYVIRSAVAGDARRRQVEPTPRGRQLLVDSAAAFEEVATAWRERVGGPAVDDLHGTLRALGVSAGARLDLPGWAS